MKKGAPQPKKIIGTLKNEVNNFNILQINKVNITIQVSIIRELTMECVFMNWVHQSYDILRIKNHWGVSWTWRSMLSLGSPKSARIPKVLVSPWEKTTWWWYPIVYHLLYACPLKPSWWGLWKWWDLKLELSFTPWTRGGVEIVQENECHDQIVEPKGLDSIWGWETISSYRTIKVGWEETKLAKGIGARGFIYTSTKSSYYELTIYSWALGG